MPDRDLLTGLTSAQMIQRDQQHQAEEFDLARLGVTMVLTWCAVLVASVVIEWWKWHRRNP